MNTQIFLNTNQKVFAIGGSILMFALILELVRRGKLRAEYSWLWLLTGATVFALVVRQDLLAWLTSLIGAVVPSSTMYACAILFLMSICVHFSVKISQLTDNMKELAQEMAILQNRLDNLGSDKDV